MAAPRVSIIIDNYNYARFLREAIDSALNQTYADREVIVVDDGSTDESRQIIGDYGDRVVPVLKENGGQGSAFNAGFAIARGELICFLDSDDLWLPNKVQETVDYADRHPDAVVIYHQLQTVDAEGNLIRKPRPPRVLNGWIGDRAATTGGYWPYPPCSALSFRRSFLERVLPMPEAPFRICADSYMADIAPFAGPVAGFARVLTRYRAHGGNNWIASEAEKRVKLLKHAERFGIQLDELNKALKRLDLPYQVRLEDHWLYHLLQRKAGGGASWAKIAGLIIRCKTEPWYIRTRILAANLVEVSRERLANRASNREKQQ